MAHISGVLVEVPISEKIKLSTSLTIEEKEQFLKLLLYFTPTELEELKELL